MDNPTQMKPLVEVDKGVWLRPESVTAIIAQRGSPEERIPPAVAIDFHGPGEAGTVTRLFIRCATHDEAISLGSELLVKLSVY